MKVILILTSLCMIWFFSSNSAHALLLATPLELWESSQMILDGTVREFDVLFSIDNEIPYQCAGHDSGCLCQLGDKENGQ